MTDVSSEQEKDAVIESTTKTLDGWKGRIDELKVHADLAKLDVREVVLKQLGIAENAWLAAYSRLRDLRHDGVTTADSLRGGIGQLIDDIKEAIEAAEAVISRG
jgi:hypothetical protein